MINKMYEDYIKKLKIKIDANKINKLLKAANVKVEPFWAKVFEKALKSRNISDLLVGGGAPAPAA